MPPELTGAPSFGQNLGKNYIDGGYANVQSSMSYTSVGRNQLGACNRNASTLHSGFK